MPKQSIMAGAKIRAIPLQPGLPVVAPVPGTPVLTDNGVTVYSSENCTGESVVLSRGTYDRATIEYFCHGWEPTSFGVPQGYEAHIRSLQSSADAAATVLHPGHWNVDIIAGQIIVLHLAEEDGTNIPPRPRIPKQAPKGIGFGPK